MLPASLQYFAANLWYPLSYTHITSISPLCAHSIIAPVYMCLDISFYADNNYVGVDLYLLQDDLSLITYNDSIYKQDHILRFCELGFLHINGERGGGGGHNSAHNNNLHVSVF